MRLWIEGLGFIMDREIRHEDRLICCMVHNEHIYCWLNQRAGSPIKPNDYEGIWFYQAPADIHGARECLKQLAYTVPDIEYRDYGQTEFVLTDDDGYSHCLGVATKL
jgi:hypothetical protein